MKTAQELGIKIGDIMMHGKHQVKVINTERVFLSKNMITVNDIKFNKMYYACADSLTKI